MCAEFPGRDAADQLPEALLAAVLLPGLGIGEVQILDGDGLHAGGLGPVEQSGEGVAVISSAGRVVEELAGFADRVAVGIEPPGGEVVVFLRVQEASRYRRPRVVSRWIR
ncbi:hypothetical protein GCM10010121_061710 [Streptomyces brasiliensis]|uniref:Uncharacterized protein n=1 Tax=Streptomyces brasiliensis TaxID=1954 RepID=A0A917L618_9ACTN|nr:hypothetical protein GCM10010121_061710 [Streptomyces brasiliensis]